jgi:RNA polymerase sigma-70 factor (ECF subfamily)
MTRATADYLSQGGSTHRMTNETITAPRSVQEAAVIERFLDSRDEATFADLFRVFSPKLVAFFRARGSAHIAEDLAQEVMLAVCRKAGQVRDHRLFRAWVFTIARNTLSRYYARQTRDVDMVDLSELPEGLAAVSPRNGGAPAFEFNLWMDLLDPRDKEVLTLRFVEEWEYHEIAAAQNIPIGTVQSRVFSAKRKLAPLLKRAETSQRTTRHVESKAA